MIISHRHRFIFLKTRKTAGTSVETALSALCGDNDIITPISPDDEIARVEFAGRGAQNTQIPLRLSAAVLRDRRSRRPQWPRFYNHMPAALVKSSVPDDVWHEYFKFSIERNPFDRVISQYYFITRNDTSPPALETWIAANKHPSNWPIYSIDNDVVADYVIRYEALGDGLAAISERIGAEVVLPDRRAKAGIRLDHRPPRDVLSDQAVTCIRQQCSRELEHWGYEVGDQNRVVDVAFDAAGPSWQRFGESVARDSA
jgi:hypothetical protein